MKTFIIEFVAQTFNGAELMTAEYEAANEAEARKLFAEEFGAFVVVTNVFDVTEYPMIDDSSFDAFDDGQALASAGFGTDEDYGHYSDHADY